VLKWWLNIAYSLRHVGVRQLRRNGSTVANTAQRSSITSHDLLLPTTGDVPHDVNIDKIPPLIVTIIGTRLLLMLKVTSMAIGKSIIQHSIFYERNVKLVTLEM